MGVAVSAASAQRPSPNWRVRTIHGNAHEGSVAVADGALTVSMGEGQAAQRVPLEEVQDAMPLERSGDARSYPRGGRIWLRAGNQFPLDKATGEERTLTVASPVLRGEWAYNATVVAAIRFPRDKAADDTRFQASLAAPGKTDDFLLALNPEGEVQRLSVKVRAFSATGVTVEFAGKVQPELPYERVYGIVFGQASGAAPDPLPKPRAQLRLHSGEKLTGKLSGLDGEAARLATAEGHELVLETESIQGIEFVTDKLVYLSDLEPAKAEQVPAFDRTWPWMIDRSPAGASIELGGVTYGRGLVLFPRTRLHYSLGDGFDHFEAVLGIEDRAGPQAHAVFRVFADDELLFESEPMTVGADPETIKLPVKDRSVLVIEADFGKNFDLGDHCVFAEARVTQK